MVTIYVHNWQHKNMWLPTKSDERPDNYILSQYDAHIIELEEQIEDLEQRLNNLCDVSDVLETVLNVVEGNDNE